MIGIINIGRRAITVNVSSCILSLVSPVLQKMLCGNFKESICKEIRLDDVDAGPFLKLVGFACGNEGLVTEDMEELLDLGTLAERFHMDTLNRKIEEMLLQELHWQNCVELFQRSQSGGLQHLQKGCYQMLRDDFEVISHNEGFLQLSEETMHNLLEEDELGAGQEEDVLQAVLRWMTRDEKELRGKTLLRKIRCGLLGDGYLTGNVYPALAANETLTELVREAMAVKRFWQAEPSHGKDPLCEKWMVARKLESRIVGANILKDPVYVAVNLRGQTVVSDKGLNEIIVFDRNGTVLRRFGSKETGTKQFSAPRGIAVDGKGHIVVADFGNHRIQVLNGDGSIVRCFGSKGNAVGELNGPCGVAVDREGHIVVAELLNDRIQIFDGDGSALRNFGSHGSGVGQLFGPTDVTVDGVGRIVVVDQGNHRVQVFNDDGSVALCFGSEGNRSGQLKYPHGLAIDRAGRYVVSDSGNDRVQVFNTDGSLARVVGKLGEFRNPHGVVVDGTGRIIVVEGTGIPSREANRRVLVFKLRC